MRRTLIITFQVVILIAAGLFSDFQARVQDAEPASLPPRNVQGVAGKQPVQSEHRTFTIATVGDSMADGVWYGMRAQPRLLKDHGIHLVRWSRANTGLTRTDQFDYLDWLRENDDLGTADFCVVQLGANDLQSIAIGPNTFLTVGTPNWQRIYQDRLESLLDTLKATRCNETVWLLQPAYENNRYLSRYNSMINGVQRAALKSASIAAFDINAAKDDYVEDGVHFNGPFVMKLGQAVVQVFETWRLRQSCTVYLSPATSPEVAAMDISPLLLSSR
ncbi:MAG: GDSL-type esterase/lipase family protein [Terriglobales bacterium]